MRVKASTESLTVVASSSALRAGRLGSLEASAAMRCAHDNGGSEGVGVGGLKGEGGVGWGRKAQRRAHGGTNPAGWWRVAGLGLGTGGVAGGQRGGAPCRCR